jgi:hypothetical protein
MTEPNDNDPHSDRSGLFDDAPQWGRVAIAGDWHGSIGWIQAAIPRLHRQLPDVTTIFHLGDFGIYPERRGTGFLAAVDDWCKTAGIQRVIVTPGNHEDWGRLGQRFASRPGQPIQLRDVIWVLPRGYRFELGGHIFMSFGGAASVDYEDRTENRDWWATEVPTDPDVAGAIAGGPVDVLLTHETVDGGTHEVERILRSNPQGWGWEALAYSAESRRRVTRVWDAPHPKVLAHGHIHVQGEVALEDGRRVYSLGCDEQRGNLALLDPASLAWAWLEE